jgi:hypothetical protein
MCFSGARPSSGAASSVRSNALDFYRERPLLGAPEDARVPLKSYGRRPFQQQFYRKTGLYSEPIQRVLRSKIKVYVRTAGHELNLRTKKFAARRVEEGCLGAHAPESVWAMKPSGLRITFDYSATIL